MTSIPLESSSPRLSQHAWKVSVFNEYVNVQPRQGRVCVRDAYKVVDPKINNICILF